MLRKINHQKMFVICCTSIAANVEVLLGQIYARDQFQLPSSD
jgi:hypothetical protein